MPCFAWGLRCGTPPLEGCCVVTVPVTIENKGEDSDAIPVQLFCGNVLKTKQRHFWKI